MIRTLSNTRQPVWLYVLKAATLSFIPCIGVSMILSQIAPDQKIEFKGSAAAIAFGTLVIAPLLETLLMWPILWFLKLFTERMYVVAACSALIWAVLHSLSAPIWGLGVVWAFFVFSVCFMEWRKESAAKAIVVTALVHTVHNILPTLSIISQK